MAVSRYQRRYPRIRNPAGTWGGSFAAAGLGGLGGVVAGGLDWGADYLPWAAWAQAATLGGAGLVTGVLVSKFADTRAGAGIFGGTVALCVNRIRQIVALSGSAPGSTTASESSAVIRSGAGAIRRGAGATPRTTATTMRRGQLMGPSYLQQQAGASVQAPGTKYGPTSWVYQRGAQAVYVSAHNLPTK